MRYAWLVLTVLVAILGYADRSAAAPSSVAIITLADVSHALDDRTLTVTGWVENRGGNAVSRLVIDAQGFAPSGELVAFGSDGIPWELRPGSSERFSIAVPVPTQLIRDYVVQVSTLGSPVHLYASQRRSVRIDSYRALLLARIGVESDLQSDMLRVRASTAGLPVTQVTVRATVLLERKFRTEVFTVDVDVPADGTVILPLGMRRAITLLSVRIVDIQLKTAWSD